jgi:hypothetical protein
LGKQRYKCNVCNYVFENNRRVTNTEKQQLWIDYSRQKQTYKSLSGKHKKSLQPIQKYLDFVKVDIPLIKPHPTVIIMDTSYFGSFGVMVFRDSYKRENLLWNFVAHENLHFYISGINKLKSMGWEILAIVCDGKRGLFKAFNTIPVQMCQFHQAAIIRKYITKNPRMPAAIELKEITSLMKQTDKESFEGALNEWHDRWKTFLNERTINQETGKSFYTHKRLRSAYRSLRTNLKWLFKWYDYIDLGIPNTTNAIDLHFSDLKNKLRNHNGLSIKRKIKFIDEFLKA